MVLKFEAHDVPFLVLGKSIDKSEGQKVIVIGNPRGLRGTVSDGLISAFRDHRSIIQITAPTSPGSSGSPVLDETGQVIAIVTAQTPEGQNLNFTIAVEKISSSLTAPAQRSDLIEWGWDDAFMNKESSLVTTVPDVAYVDRDTGKLVATSLHQHPYAGRTTAPALQKVTVDFRNGWLLDRCTGAVVATLYPALAAFDPREEVDANEHEPYPWMAVPPVTPVNK